jgi:hypothetical protein
MRKTYKEKNDVKLGSKIKANNVCNIVNQVDHEVAKSKPSSTT